MCIGAISIKAYPRQGAATERCVSRVRELAQERSIDRMGQQYQAFQDAEGRPISQGLRAAEMGLEGAGLLADVFPVVAAAGTSLAALIARMSMRNDVLGNG